MKTQSVLLLSLFFVCSVRGLALQDDLKIKERVLKKRCGHVLKPLPFSCQDIKKKYPKAVSGVYFIRNHLRVYCEMAINGGGYTFLPRRSIRQGSSIIRHLFKQKRSVMLRFQRPDGTQPYTIITQLPRFSRSLLSVQQNSYTGYTRPQNTYLGAYIFLGIIPAKDARKRTTQGFRSNGRNIVFNNCDANPNSYFAFFPNHKEKNPSSYHGRNLIYERKRVAVDWRRSGKRMPSSRVMPRDFFFFTEMHFGGCGTYTSSDRWLKSTQPALDTAIGVR